jgi:hypothetical protein
MALAVGALYDNLSLLTAASTVERHVGLAAERATARRLSEEPLVV